MTGSGRPESAGPAAQVTASPHVTEVLVTETATSEAAIATVVVTETVVSESPGTDAGTETVVATASPDSRPIAGASVDPDHTAPAPTGAGGQPSTQAGDVALRTTTCTTAQLRRFIKSRAYMPMHELRRRFLINGSEDDVTRVEVDGSAVFVGLPEREGRMLGDLLRGGEVGYELSHDPVSPIVVGVFPMRPIPRA